MACEINATYAELARGYWREAGVDHKVELVVAPAADTLAGLVAMPGEHCSEPCAIQKRSGYFKNMRTMGQLINNSESPIASLLT